MAQNKKLFREKQSIQLHVAVNLCHMNFLQMNFQNKIWLKVKIPGSNYRGFSVYSATTLANFFLPRLIMRPSPLKSSRVYLVEISVTFSSATDVTTTTNHTTMATTNGCLLPSAPRQPGLLLYRYLRKQPHASHRKTDSSPGLPPTMPSDCLPSKIKRLQTVQITSG